MCTAAGSCGRPRRRRCASHRAVPHTHHRPPACQWSCSPQHPPPTHTHHLCKAKASACLPALYLHRLHVRCRYMQYIPTYAVHMRQARAYPPHPPTCVMALASSACSRFRSSWPRARTTSAAFPAAASAALVAAASAAWKRASRGRADVRHPLPTYRPYTYLGIHMAMDMGAPVLPACMSHHRPAWSYLEGGCLRRLGVALRLGLDQLGHLPLTGGDLAGGRGGGGGGRQPSKRVSSHMRARACMRRAERPLLGPGQCVDLRAGGGCAWASGNPYLGMYGCAHPRQLLASAALVRCSERQAGA